MEAIPSRPDVDERPAVTGISCPDCPGVLEVTNSGDWLRFRCRIGHVYSLTDLIQSKEQRLENLLWAPVTALDEFAHILLEAVASGEAGASRAAYEERASRALRHVEALRVIIDDSSPTAIIPDPETPEGDR
jgi:two-component system, chemotaxis family, protein-glutamate methylesterase/glutaminase